MTKPDLPISCCGLASLPPQSPNSPCARARMAAPEHIALLDDWLRECYEDAHEAAGQWEMASSEFNGPGEPVMIFANSRWPLSVEARWAGGILALSEAPASCQSPAAEPWADFGPQDRAPLNGWEFELMGADPADGLLAASIFRMANGPSPVLGAGDCDGMLPPMFHARQAGLFATPLSPSQARSFLLACGFAERIESASHREAELAGLELAAGSANPPPMGEPIVEAAIRDMGSLVARLIPSASEEGLLGALHEASKRGHASCLAALAPMFPASFLGGALFAAAASGKVESLSILAQRGADLFERSQEGFDAAAIAAQNQRPDFLRSLFAAWTLCVERGSISSGEYCTRVSEASIVRSEEWTLDVESMGAVALAEREPQILAAQESRLLDQSIRQGTPSKASRRI